MLIRNIAFFIYIFFSINLFSQVGSQLDSLLVWNNRISKVHDSSKLDTIHKYVLRVKDWQLYTEASYLIVDNPEKSYAFQYKYLNVNNIEKFKYIFAFQQSIRIYEPIIDEEYFNDYISLKKVKPLQRHRKSIHRGSWDKNLGLVSFFRENSIKDTSTFLFWAGLKYYDYENFQKASFYFKQSIEAATLHNDYNSLVAALSYYGKLMYERENYDLALASSTQALNLAIVLNDTIREAALYNNIGEIQYKLKRFSESVEMFRKVLTDYQNLPEKRREPIQLVKIGKVLVAQNRFKEAHQNFSMAIQKAKIINEPIALRDAYYFSSILLQKQNKAEQALNYYARFTEIKDSLFAEELDFFVKERENYWQSLIGREISKKEYHGLINKQNTIELNRNRTITVILISMSALLLLLVVLGYRVFNSSRRANKYLKDLNETRNKFFSIVSHDLRAPLNGFINLLTPIQKQADRLSKEQILEYASEMNTLAGKTLFMLDNILKWANLQRGFLKPNPERFLLDEVILFNIDLYSSIAKNRNIDISYSSNANIFVYADRNMVDATIRNLLNNAIKFTGQNGIISINHRIYDEFVEVQISDTGVGIDADKIKTLLSFESNSKKSSGSDKDGSGLGLVLAREFIEKNGGAMWVHSAGLGKGSTFYFTLKQHTP